MTINLERLGSQLVQITLFDNKLYFSYEDLIAIWLSDGTKLRIDKYISLTTSKHIGRLHADHWQQVTEQALIDKVQAHLHISSSPLKSLIKQPPRPLSIITTEIKKDWKNIPNHIKPYVDVLATLNDPNDHYGYDLGKELIKQFLSHARTWRGEVARRIKLELKTLAR